MSKSVSSILASCTLILAILACNMPGGQSTDQPDLAATITAQAALIPATGNETSTPAPAVPMVTVSQSTNCRTGPTTAYDIVISFNPGQTAVVIGKDPADNYWIINNPNGNGTCWLWGQYATVTGNTDGLPQMAPPAPPEPKATKTPKPTKTPTSTPGSVGPITIHPIFPILTLVLAPPNAPTNLAQSRTCGAFFDGIIPKWSEAVTLTWNDSADESGYHIYKNNALVSTIPQDSTSYHITLRYDQGTGGPLYDTFAVEAFNSGGVAASKPALDVPRCP